MVLIALALLFACLDLAAKSLAFSALDQRRVACPACAAPLRLPAVPGYTAVCPACGARVRQGDAGAPPAEHEVVPRLLYLQLALNTGGLFGLGGGHTEAFIAFSALTIGLVVWMFACLGRAGRVPRLALAMVLGGALGNLWDRIFYHSVRDFILIYIVGRRWPNFNVADVWICLGVGLLVCWLWRHPEPQRVAPEGRIARPRR